MQVYGLITCVRRANENAGNLISGVQFLINIYIYMCVFVYVCACVFIYLSLYMCVSIYLSIFIYINCKLLCRMKILKSMKTKVFLFFAFVLRVSPLLRLFRHSKVCLLTYYVTDVILIIIIKAPVIQTRVNFLQ